MPINSELIFRDKLATIEHEVSLYSVTAIVPVACASSQGPSLSIVLSGFPLR